MSSLLKPFRPALNFVKAHSPKPVGYGLDLAEFFVVQRLVGFKVPSTPVFDPVGSKFFMAAIEQCHGYLEFGGGGSTVVASRLGKPFVSVDSDPYFVRALLAHLPAKDQSRVICVDTGVTGLWGAPLFRSQPERRRALWRQYPHAPWMLLSKLGLKPDLVLLDGRFRVACALVCLKHLGSDPDVVMLVDDYEGRPDYAVIEQYARLVAMHGRMAEFRLQDNDPVELARAIERFELDWR